MKFNYEENTEVDVASVADSIRSSCRLKPLTDQLKLRRQLEQEIWREEQAFLAEQRRAERERRQQEAEAIARHEAATALAERNRQLRLEQEKRNQERQREQTLVGLQIRATQQEVWANNVETAARAGLMQRQRQALMNELDAMIAPAPTPEPEQTVAVADDGLGSPNIADEDFNPRYWLRKPIFRR
jgi:hypothetical protein